MCVVRRYERKKIVKVALEDGFEQAGLAERDVVAVDEGLRELEKVDWRVATVIEMRFFGGMQDAEIGEALNISRSTVKRDWVFGRAWLLDYMRQGGG